MKINEDDLPSLFQITIAQEANAKSIEALHDLFERQQLKNRYNDKVANRKFILGINRAKMKLSDVKRDEQDGLVQSNQTQTSTLGSGFNGENFEEKFQADKRADK